MAGMRRGVRRGFTRLSDRVGGGSAQGIEIVSNAYGATSSLTLPSGIEAGDLILAYIANDSSTLPGTPTGYTSIETASASTTARLRAIYKIADGTETTITTTNQTRCAAIIFRGASGIGNTNKNDGLTTVNTFILKPASITDGSLVVGGYYNANATLSAAWLASLNDGTTVQMLAVSPNAEFAQRFMDSSGSSYFIHGTGPRCGITVEVLAA